MKKEDGRKKKDIDLSLVLAPSDDEFCENF